MKNKIKYIPFLVMCMLLHVSLNAQDALTADYWDATTIPGQCQDGIIDLHINGGFPPYDVEWQKLEVVGQGYNAEQRVRSLWRFDSESWL